MILLWVFSEGDICTAERLNLKKNTSVTGEKEMSPHRKATGRKVATGSLTVSHIVVEG